MFGLYKYFTSKNMNFLLIKLLLIFQAKLQLFDSSAIMTPYKHSVENIYLWLNAKFLKCAVKENRGSSWLIKKNKKQKNATISLATVERETVIWFLKLKMKSPLLQINVN